MVNRRVFKSTVAFYIYEILGVSSFAYILWYHPRISVCMAMFMALILVLGILWVMAKWLAFIFRED